MVKRLVVLLLLLSLTAFAQTVEWTSALSTPRCNVGEQVVLELRLSGATTDPLEPRVPDIPGVSMEFAGASKNVSMINGVTSSSSTYTYILTPTQQGSITVPAIAMSVDGQSYTTEPLKLQVGVSSGQTQPGAPGVPPGGVGPNGAGWGGPQNQLPSAPIQSDAQPVLVECEVSNTHPYVGELVVYTFRFLHRVQLAGSVNFEPPPPTGMLREDLGQSTNQVTRNGMEYAQSEVRTAYFPTSPGSLTIAPTRLSCQLAPDFLDPSFSFRGDGVRELSTQPVTLEVLPLPTQGRPPSFNGAVGRHFELLASLNKTLIKAGDPVKLAVTITGDEHPDLLLDPTLPNWPGVRSYTPEASALPYEKPNFRASKTFKIPLVPQQGGDFQLHDLSWSYFDPASRRYVTLTANPMVLKVEGSIPTTAGGKAPAPGAPVDPLRGPQPGLDSGQGWALEPGVAVLAVLPWGISLVLLVFGHAHQQYELSLQTDRARLQRLEKRVQRAKTLEELAQLAYQGLEIRKGMALIGLPLVRLREILSQEMVDELEKAEAARYSPEGDTDPKKVDEFRNLLLRELRGGEA
ncbi:MAG: protein BatD [Candidatus Eremiobacteraeota bacterium]|nr:protein BatD [Candidatus Eremiobacteraeota bacterium]